MDSGRGSAGGRPRTHILKATFECMADGVVVVGNEGRFLFFNQAAQTILGLGALDTAPDE